MLHAHGVAPRAHVCAHGVKSGFYLRTGQTAHGVEIGVLGCARGWNGILGVAHGVKYSIFLRTG